MKKKDLSCLWGIIFTIIAFLFLFFAAILQGSAQNVIRKGDVFIQVPSENKIQKDSATLTKYVYQDKEGKRYPIYKSEKGKYFIIRISSKTGKSYKMYLPKITEQLNENGQK